MTPLTFALSPQTAARVRAGKPIRFKANWVGEVTASRHFIDEMKAARITEGQLQSIKCPVRLMHATDVSTGSALNLVAGSET